MNKRNFLGKSFIKKMNKKGVSQVIVVSLMIVGVVALGFLVFKWISGTVQEGGQKGGDRALVEDLCREEVKIRVDKVEKEGEFLIINVENLKQRVLGDFLVRYEAGKEIEIQKARQVLGGYENANIKVKGAGFEPSLVKVIPQIILEKPELESMDKGWWLCSGQMAIYSL